MLFKTFLASTKVLPSSRPTEVSWGLEVQQAEPLGEAKEPRFWFSEHFFVFCECITKANESYHLIYYLQSSSSFKKILSRYFQRFYDFFFHFVDFSKF